MVKIYENKNDFGFLINEYAIIKDLSGTTVDKRRWDGQEFKRLTYTKIKDFKSRSDKQDCACDMLSNKDIGIKILSGVSGSGKSKLAIVHGLYFVEKQIYSKLFSVRHNVGIGRSNGFLPGSKVEKIMAWLGFLKDNTSDSLLTIEEMINRETLELDGVEFLKGRDIKDAWIMIDECEDLTQPEFQMIGERCSEKSVICFIGDLDQATQEEYKRSSGLKRAIENLKGLSQVGIIVFDDKELDNVRSDVSRIFTSKY
jgi:predicted ribonuclease YlaK